MQKNSTYHYIFRILFNHFINLQTICYLHIHIIYQFGFIHLLSNIHDIFVKSPHLIYLRLRCQYHLSPHSGKTPYDHFSTNFDYLHIPTNQQINDHLHILQPLHIWFIANLHWYTIYLRITTIFIFELSPYFDVPTNHHLSLYHLINHWINIIYIFFTNQRITIHLHFPNHFIFDLSPIFMVVQFISILFKYSTNSLIAFYLIYLHSSWSINLSPY